MDEQSLTHAWRKSSRCGTSGCVEIAKEGVTYLMRDSKDPHSPVLRFSPEAWGEFTARVRAGELDG